MTPEEIQKTIEGMLRVQKELQESQIKQSEEIQQLLDQGRLQDKRIQQLIGYSISQAGDVLDVQINVFEGYICQIKQVRR